MRRIESEGNSRKRGGLGTSNGKTLQKAIDGKKVPLRGERKGKRFSTEESSGTH